MLLAALQGSEGLWAAGLRSVVQDFFPAVTLLLRHAVPSAWPVLYMKISPVCLECLRLSH
jgi:hypothetical protein